MPAYRIFAPLLMQVSPTINIDELNERYEKLTPVQRIQQLFSDFDPKRVLLTSSFATHSAFFLHLWATATDSKQAVHFIDTTYHFPETIESARVTLSAWPTARALLSTPRTKREASRTTACSSSTPRAMPP